MSGYYPNLLSSSSYHWMMRTNKANKLFFFFALIVMNWTNWNDSGIKFFFPFFVFSFALYLDCLFGWPLAVLRWWSTFFLLLKDGQQQRRWPLNILYGMTRNKKKTWKLSIQGDLVYGGWKEWDKNCWWWWWWWYQNDHCRFSSFFLLFHFFSFARSAL